MTGANNRRCLWSVTAGRAVLQEPSTSTGLVATPCVTPKGGGCGTPPPPPAACAVPRRAAPVLPQHPPVAPDIVLCRGGTGTSPPDRIPSSA